ncbi:MAG: hypothetical protein U1F37_14030 [Alphaproteobacteria bacterium]
MSPPDDEIEAAAERILGRLDGFQRQQVLPSSLNLPQTSLRQLGTPIGVYMNTAGSLEDALLITSKGIVWIRGDRAPQLVLFAHIEKCEIEGTSKTSASIIKIQFADGDIVLLPIRGGQGKFRDIFEFWRFLRKAKKTSSR